MITVTRRASSRADEIDRARAGAVAEVNAITNETRLRYITGIAGQEMTYREKEREAAAYLAAPSDPPDAAVVPFLIAEAAKKGITVYQLAQAVLYFSEQWRQLGPVIEAGRTSSNDAITAADDPAAMAAIVAAFRAEMKALPPG